MIRKFSASPELVQQVAMQEIAAVSPARLLSNVFWESLDYRLLMKILEDNLKILELGCGSGAYGERVSRLSNVSAYTGIDIKDNPNWYKLDSTKFAFLKDTYENFDLLVTNQNLIITQSALEHFEKDITLFQQIDAYASTCEYPVASIHVMPSASSLYTFLWHGIRQYGRAHLSNLRATSISDSQFRVYTIGGVPLNWFHFRNITFPQIFSKTPLISRDKDTYFNLLLEATKRDSKTASTRFSVFSAIIIIWNADEWDSSLVPIH